MFSSFAVQNHSGKTGTDGVGSETQAVGPVVCHLPKMGSSPRPLLLLLCVRGLSATRRQCPTTMECRLQSQCPAFLRQRDQLESLGTSTTGYGQLLNRLKGRVCESATKKVCCAPVDREISGAIGPTLPHEFPFMVRLTIRVKLQPHTQ